MLADSITLDAVDGTDVVFKLIRSSTNGTTRIDVTTNLSAPALMEIKHETRGKGSDQIDRHLVSLSRTVVDSSGVPRVATCNFTVAVPRSTAITSTIVKNLISNMIDFMADGSIASLATTANIDALLRGEG